MIEKITKCPCCGGLAIKTVVPPDCPEGELGTGHIEYETIAAERASEEWYRNIHEIYRPATPSDIARVARFHTAAIKAGTEVEE